MNLLATRTTHRKNDHRLRRAGHHIKDFCRSHRVDLVICGNHNHSSFHAPPARRKVSSAAAALMSCWFLERANAG